MKHDEFIVRLLPKVAEPIIHAHYNLNCCIAATAIGVRVLKHFGVQAWPLEVAMVVANREGATMMSANVPPSEWPDSAWSVGVDRERNGLSHTLEPQAWEGAHLVAVARPEESAFIVDLSLKQAARPSKGMPVEATVIKVPREWAREPGTVMFEDDETGVLLWIQPYVPQQPELWTGHQDFEPYGRARPVGDLIIDTMKKVLRPN